MTRSEFMQKLESLLLDIPLEEKEEALQYYTDYFEDAGEEHEEEIIKELGSPERVASIIKADLNSNAADRENRGYFTEKGYEDTLYKEDKYEIVGAHKKEAGSNEKAGNTSNTYYTNGSGNTGNSYQQNNNGWKQGTNATNNTSGYNNQGAGHTTQSKSNTNIALIIILCILAIPVGLPLFGSFIGIVFAILGIIFGLGVAGIAMMVAGIAMFVAGLIKIAVPFIGLVLCGAGLIVFGIGILFTLFTGFLCKTVLPAMIKGIVNLCRLPFKNRSVVA